MYKDGAKNPQGSERQLTRTSFAQFESYVVKGAHGVKTNMGIYNPGVPPVFTPSSDGG